MSADLAAVATLSGEMQQALEAIASSNGSVKDVLEAVLKACGVTAVFRCPSCLRNAAVLRHDAA